MLFAGIPLFFRIILTNQSCHSIRYIRIVFQEFQIPFYDSFLRSITYLNICFNFNFNFNIIHFNFNIRSLKLNT